MARAVRESRLSYSGAEAAYFPELGRVHTSSNPSVIVDILGMWELLRMRSGKGEIGLVRFARFDIYGDKNRAGISLLEGVWSASCTADRPCFEVIWLGNQ